MAKRPTRPVRRIRTPPTRKTSPAEINRPALSKRKKVAPDSPGIFRGITPDFIGNIFTKGRDGHPVIRPDDLLTLRIELRNLTIKPGSPPTIIKAKKVRGAAYLILHFPPQAITEESFYEVAPEGMEPDSPDEPIGDPTLPQKIDPDRGQGSEDLPTARTIRARIADESRLVFKIPHGLVIPYNLEGILSAVQDLELRVAANALPRGRKKTIVAAHIDTPILFQRSAIKKLTSAQRGNMSSFASNSLSIAWRDPSGATLARRQFLAGTGLSDASNLATKLPAPYIIARPPKPAPPNALTTAIELPWRLILSPHKNTRWQHAVTPVTSPATQHTELWHSRLVAPDSDGNVIQPPYADRNRTVRAIWAKTGEGSENTMGPDLPNSANLEVNTQPFRMPMDDFDRIQIAHLSSNFANPKYTPNPVDTHLMMLTALGGWLDSRGGWVPPGGLSVEEWVHRASMARDHYVKVVYKGCLFCLGHQVSLVKVTERKFHNGSRKDAEEGQRQGPQQIEQKPGNPAYLRQRMFIVIRERERCYDDTQLKSNDEKINLALQFPFTKVRILTEVTPNLDDPQDSEINNKGQRFFWPTVLGEPFKFQCVGTDLDGNRIAFELPLIFMDNTIASPFSGTTENRWPDWDTAADNAVLAMDEFANKGTRKTVDMKLQRVALATSIKSGDTSVQVESMDFGGFAEASPPNTDLKNASNQLKRALFYPMISGMDARIGAMSHLTGTGKSNRLEWHEKYLLDGFNNQVGQVFAKIISNSNMARLDFSAQGDRSGGFVQPNIEPQALSRFAGPIMGDVDAFIDGHVPPGGGFPSSPSELPLPLIFGCIPLSAIIDVVGDISDTPEGVPKFATDAGNKLEGFINSLVRLLNFITDIASQPANIANAAIATIRSTLADHITQAGALTAVQSAQLETAINNLDNELQTIATQLGTLLSTPLEAGQAAPSLGNFPNLIIAARAEVTALMTTANTPVAGVDLPSGLRQSLLSISQKTDDLLLDLQTLPTLIIEGKILFDALDAIVGNPEDIGSLLTDAEELKNRVQAIADAISDLKTTASLLNLLAGAPRKIIVDAMALVEDAVGVVANLSELIENLTGDELTIRFDWQPEISSFPTSDPIFRVNDKRGFSVAVKAEVKKHGDTTPKVSVICGLKHFDLVLIAPASFIELQFEKIEFSVDSGAKMDVDVLLTDIKFVGPLSFVEVLKDLIPLDGFSDPPFLDISSKGIDAGFSIALPTVAVGVLNLSNLSLGAGFTVPFIGQPLSVRFNFCTREQPFLLTVYMFGGGGFFGVTIDPNGVQILEASFEFGAAISIDLGVASGGVSVMAGIYFRMEQDDASLTGYFRLAGHVDVLGLITASLELYLALRYEFESGKAVGEASLTIEISLFIFSGSVTVRCERKFAGSNGDPNLRQMLGLNAALTLAQELAAINSADVIYPWREHCEAFA